MLAPGARLGAYEIVALVGAGGMGEVYRARDAALNRDVALKVLPQSVAADPDRLARFTREAQTLAALNHPHIAHIYGLEQSCIVMEFVDGDDLAQRIARGPIPIDESIAIGAQISQALEAAHEQGVIHRDLKPANIKVSGDGTVKILDFGLAKMTDMAPGFSAGDDRHTPSISPTVMSPAMTGAGVILGTAAYMAPEQAKGKPVDKRVDIWAFGVVLYEMLSGRTLFAGESVAETIGLVVTREPDWSALPASTPPRIAALLRRCLTKDPHDRLRDIGEARFALTRRDEAVRETPPSSRRSPLSVAAAAAFAFALGAIGAGLVLRRAPATTTAPPRRFELPPAIASASVDPVIAPDGTRLAYIAGNHLRVQALDALESQDLGGVPVSATNIFWSPDSKSVGFTADATVRTIPANGGAFLVVCKIPASGTAQGILWRRDGTILMSVWRDSLYTVAATGGTPDVLLRTDPSREVDFHAISELPGNRLLIATHLREADPNLPSADREQHEIFDGSRRTVLASASGVTHFVYAPSGHLLFVRTDANSGVWAIPFSERALDLSKAVRIEAGATRFSAADDGTLIASVRPTTSTVELAWIDRAGGVTAVPGPPIEIGEGRSASLALSPDGHRAAFVAGSPGAVVVRDLQSGIDTRLTFEDHTYDTPSWFPSGDRLLYLAGVAMTRAAAPNAAGTSFLGTIMMQRADGTDRPRQLTAATTLPRVAPDGKTLMFLVDDTGRSHLRAASIGPDGSVGPVHPFFQTADEPVVRWFDLSRDGRLLAYAAEDSSRRLNVFVTDYPTGTGRWQAEAAGNMPQFSATSGELFFLHGTVVAGEARGEFAVVPIASKPTVTVGPVTKLFDLGTPQSPSLSALGFSVAADGRRILATRRVAAGGAARRAVLVQNWPAALR